MENFVFSRSHCKSKKRATVYSCREKNELLEKIGVTTKDDTTSTHPDSLRNSCNTNITRVGRGPSSLKRFSPPSHTVLLSDLQCKRCQCIVNRPVMTECSNLLCCTCAVEVLQHREMCPACRCHHTAPPISAGAVVVKVVGSLLVHCATCGSSIELKKMKEHLLSNCSQVLPPSPSQLTGPDDGMLG